MSRSSRARAALHAGALAVRFFFVRALPAIRNVRRAIVIAAEAIHRGIYSVGPLVRDSRRNSLRPPITT